MQPTIDISGLGSGNVVETRTVISNQGGMSEYSEISECLVK